MFVNQRTFGIFKENAENLAPGKSSVSKYQKGLKSRNLNSFTDSTNVLHKNKSVSGLKAGKSNILSKEKENTKPKVVQPESKPEIQEKSDSWSDIEEMHIHIEPDDDYEDILPMCHRIQKADLDSLFINYTSCNFAELSVDKTPSPLKEYKISEVFEYSPPIPDIEVALFDDTELDLVPLTVDFPNLE